MSVGHPSHHMAVPVPVLFPGLGFGMHSTTQSPWGHPLMGLPAHPTMGAGAGPSQCSWAAACCFAGLTQTSQILFISHCTVWKLEVLMHRLIWIDFVVFKVKKKQTLLLLLLLPQFHCCINSLFLSLMVNDSPHNEVKIVCQYDQVSETKS